MAIIPNAAPDEKFSPFYRKNKQFCKEFERFIASKNGLVKGKYNACSYLVTGKIAKPTNWELVYKKSTYSTTGNLWLSSKRQGLFVSVAWKTKRISSSVSNFSIRKKKLLDNLKIITNQNLSLLWINKKYVIESSNNKSKLIHNLLSILENLFHSEEIYQIIYQNDELIITLHSEKHHFLTFKKLSSI